jgi:uncharacterized delta-60 repeat protein
MRHASLTTVLGLNDRKGDRMSAARRCLVVLSLLVSLAGIAAASPGQLDPSFGTNGVVRIESGPWGSRLYASGGTLGLDPANPDAIVVLAAVPIVPPITTYAVAVSSNGGLLAGADLGLPDDLTDYGALGRVAADPTDPSHRLYAVGSRYTEGATPPYSFLVARLTPLGNGMDPAWGSGAPIVTAVPGTTQVQATALTVQPDGKLLVAGGADANFADVAVARYETDGTLDATFGSGGTTVIPGGGIVSAVALQSDGKILLAGSLGDGAFGRGFGVMRLLPDGTLDPTFGAGFGVSRVVTTNFLPRNPQGFSVGVQALSDGRIVAAGSTYDPGKKRYGLAAARYLDDGTLDSTFGRKGRFKKRVGKSASAGAIGFLADGRILIAASGQGRYSLFDSIALLRLDTNGRPDPTFGRGGKVQTQVVNGEGLAVRDVVVDSLGRTTVVAASADGLGKATLLVRFLP